jgi:NAD(P)-dependent dehydrogenase (short-subunit alcohol dehydrogenase family)
MMHDAFTGHFYFTKLLLPVLTASAKKSPEKTVRIVNLSSLAHYRGAPEGIRWTTLSPNPESLEARKGLGSAMLFGQSKTVRTVFVFLADTNLFLICRKGNILFSNELARRYGGEGIVSIALHPGTDISSQAGSLVQRIGHLFKYALYYVVSCGDMSLMMEKRKAVVVLTENTRAHAVANLAAGEVPSLPTLDTPGPNSHIAITSLYAGTAPAAGELNGKVSDLCPQRRRGHVAQFGENVFTVSHRLGACYASA